MEEGERRRVSICASTTHGFTAILDFPLYKVMIKHLDPLRLGMGIPQNTNCNG